MTKKRVIEVIKEMRQYLKHCLKLVVMLLLVTIQRMVLDFLGDMDLKVKVLLHLVYGLMSRVKIGRQKCFGCEVRWVFRWFCHRFGSMSHINWRDVDL